MKGRILAMVAIGCCLRVAVADPAGGLPPARQRFPGLRPSQTVQTEEVRFANPQLAPVRLIRGSSQLPSGAIPASIEVLSFGGSSSQKVMVARGAPMVGPDLRKPLRIESVSFADLGQGWSVTIVRGMGQEPIDFFVPARQELDRFAFAVEGIESRHGADPGMWRPNWQGPQGPMQVSLGAAIDVGGGNRFDLHQNWILGRAYLAQMFQRYGNWPDALAAYNWGPANLDTWIAAGRRSDQFPYDVAQYVSRALRDVLTSLRQPVFVFNRTDHLTAR